MNIKILYDLIRPIKRYTSQFDDIQEVAMKSYDEYLRLKMAQGIQTLLEIEIKRTEKELERLKALNK